MKGMGPFMRLRIKVGCLIGWFNGMSHIWHVTYGISHIWHVTYGMSQMASRIWHVTYMVSHKWHVTNGTSMSTLVGLFNPEVSLFSFMVSSY